jgi:hypothetical protein
VRADAAFLLRASDAAVADRIGEALKACNADGTAQSLRTKHLRGQ